MLLELSLGTIALCSIVNLFLFFRSLKNNKVQHENNIEMWRENFKLQSKWQAAEDAAREVNEMRAKEYHEKLLEAIEEGKIQVINKTDHVCDKDILYN